MGDFLIRFYPDVFKNKMNSKGDNYCKYDNQVFQLFTSSLYLAAILATFFASVVSKKLGRRMSMLGAGMFFVVGTVIGTAAQNLSMVIAGRVLLGCGVGFANQAVPVYLSEIAPASMRGMLNLLFTLYIAVGALSGNMVNYLASRVHPWGWRISLGVAGIPALVLTICSLLIVETPSSLIERGKLEQAKVVLHKIRGITDVSGELNELLEASRMSEETSTWGAYKELFCDRRHRGEVVVACLMPFFQQVAGNDAILFYGALLFKLAGFGDQAALYSAIIVGAISFLTLSASAYFVDKVGRRFLILLGCVIMVSSLVVIGSIFATTLKGNVKKLPKAEGVVEVAMVCMFVMGFAGSIGPLAWLIPTEILSQNVRSVGQSVTVFINMLFKFIIAQTFLTMLCAFKSGVFFFFAGWGLVIATFTLFFLPETKHVPLSQMETVWQGHWFWKHIACASKTTTQA